MSNDLNERSRILSRVMTESERRDSQNRVLLAQATLFIVFLLGMIVLVLLQIHEQLVRS